MFSFQNWSVTEMAIKRALKSRAYERRITRAERCHAQEHMRVYKQWAEDHISWTTAQWSKILWKDETWINGHRHSTTWITRNFSIKTNNTSIFAGQDNLKYKSWYGLDDLGFLLGFGERIHPVLGE